MIMLGCTRSGSRQAVEVSRGGTGGQVRTILSGGGFRLKEHGGTGPAAAGMMSGSRTTPSSLAALGRQDGLF
jgi:hypothetical protein